MNRNFSFEANSAILNGSGHVTLLKSTSSNVLSPISGLSPRLAFQGIGNRTV